GTEREADRKREQVKVEFAHYGSFMWGGIGKPCRYMLRFAKPATTAIVGHRHRVEITCTLARMKSGYG
ncbi:MAG TPA: hypothetical protein VM532_06505, partial [Burkholderiales bacterium]|nr:hypothetical protein [Burkholderiales bacterium]